MTELVGFHIAHVVIDCALNAWFAAWIRLMNITVRGLLFIIRGCSVLHLHCEIPKESKVCLPCAAVHVTESFPAAFHMTSVSQIKLFAVSIKQMTPRLKY